MIEIKDDPKLAVIKRIFASVDPKAKLEYTFHDDRTCTVQGPFPSFMLMVDPAEEVIRALIHVNADAPNMVYIFGEFARELKIEQDGAFAINGETGQLLFNMDAYLKKEDNILMFAEEIKSRRPETAGELIVPEEKKIILTSR